ncbi:MAG: C10 family peptidase [Bacteroidaceae bacterium]|nr:C10 family peptidase [Bacteroidaceae bacterium]
MRKRTILALMAICVIVSIVKASPVDPQSAIQVAQQFVPKSTTAQRAPMRGSSAEPSSSIVYTHMMPNSDRPAFYIVNVDDGAFVLVSADDIAHKILGYSLSGTWPISKDGSVELPEQIKGFFDDLAAQMEAAIETEPNRAPESDWTSSRSLAPSRSDSSLPDSVGPLLTTTWDQGQYYNALCPEDENGPGGHALTGCVATAMAQIINYWGYPINGRGTHGYNSNYGSLKVNYEESTYNYENMPNILTAESTEHEVNAVSKLMYDCGVAVNMDYSANSSGSNNLSIRMALVNNFLFNNSISYVCKQSFRFTEWDSLLRSQIMDGLPIICGGVDDIDNLGHSFICDGYKSDGFFHFNFGWSGNCDGWFRTSAITAGSFIFNSAQSALINIKPCNNHSILFNYLEGNSAFVVDTTLHVYHSLGLNTYRGVQDDIYLDLDTLVFYPSNEGNQLEFNLNRHPNVYYGTNIINVYDGDNADSLLKQYDAVHNYWNGTINMDYTPILSTRGALTIEYIGYDGFDGFDYIINEYNGCRRVTDVTVKLGYSSSIISWKENGNATQWQLEYGPSGFSHGSGILLTVDTTSIMIEDLQAYVEYDLYVRPLVNNNKNCEWSYKKTFMVGESFWKDVVLSQPDGYQIDNDNNVYIYSAEGLAWLAHTYQNLDEWTIHLMNDIDLSGHTWFPLKYFRSRLEGHGHIIRNMVVLGDDDYGGLFGLCLSPLINDIHLRDVYIYNLGTSGSIAGCLSGNSLPNGQRAIIINSSATGINTSVTGRAGGIVGEMMNSAAIINCYSSCDVSGQTYVGGICGGGYKDCIINNCYTNGSATTLQMAYHGALVGYSEYTEVYDSYAWLDNCHPANVLFDAAIGSDYDNLQWFSRDDSLWRLIAPISFENDTTDILVQCLNNGVNDMNIEGLRTWVSDKTDDGLPVFGPLIEIVCPNTSDFIIHNIINENGDNGVELSWTENGEATLWELKYHIKDSIDEIHCYVYNNPDTILGLELQKNYLFSIRPIGESGNHGAWSEYTSHIVDKPYWVDVVTTQPSGYTVDNQGNINISSAEGLAWLISTVNGLNGQNSDMFSNKCITIAQNLDIGKYKWTPINYFQGVFNGGSHIIKGLYVYELTDNNGLFGKIEGGQYMNIVMDSAYVKGKEKSGILFGDVHGSKIINCHVKGAVYSELNAGGIAGSGGNNYVDRCSSIGLIEAEHYYAGGIFGDMNVGIIRNSFSRCDVVINGYGAGGLVGPCYSGIIENCYAISNVHGFMYNGGLLGTLRSPHFSAIRNCYTVGSTYGTGGDITLEGPRSGVIVGTTDGTPLISHCYGAVENAIYPLVGPPEYTYDNGYPVVSDTSSFSNNGILQTPVTVDTITYYNLFTALNGWVDANNSTGLYLHWIEDSLNENGGYPIFAPLPFYIVSFINEDGTVLQTDTLEQGVTPEYRGNTPKKDSNAQYVYTFRGWSVPLSPVIGDVTYIAIFDAHMFGDVTDNAAVDVQDATIVVNYILGERTGGYLYHMADMNNDTEIDVFDLTAIINVILGRTSFQAPMRTGSSGYETTAYLFGNESTNIVGEEDIYLRHVSDKIGLSIANASRFTSFQMDVEVPDGAELQNVELTGCERTHIVQKAKIGDNMYRVIALSMSSQPLADVNDELVSFQITNAANAEISVSNVMFVTPKGEAHYFNGASTMTPTIINEITTDNDEVIFDLSGRRIYKKPNELERGVYIIDKKKVVIK